MIFVAPQLQARYYNHTINTNYPALLVFKQITKLVYLIIYSFVVQRLNCSLVIAT